MTSQSNSKHSSPQSGLLARRALEDSSSERASKRLFTRQDDSSSQFEVQQRGMDTDATNHQVFVPTPIIHDTQTNSMFSLQASHQLPLASDLSAPSAVTVPDLTHMWAPATSPPDVNNNSQSPSSFVAKHEDSHSLHSLGGFKRANSSPRVRYHASIATHGAAAGAASASSLDIEDQSASPVDSRKDALPRFKQWLQLLPVRYGYPRLVLYSLVSLFIFISAFRFLLAAQPAAPSPYAVAAPEAYDSALALEVQSLKQSDEFDGASSMQSMIEKLDNVVYKSVRKNGGAVAAAAAAANANTVGSEHAVLLDIINAKSSVTMSKGVAGINDVTDLPHAINSAAPGEEPSAPHSLDEMPSMLSNMIIPLPNTPEAAAAAKAAAAAAKAKEKKAEQDRLRAKNAEKTKAHQADAGNKDVQSHLTELTEKRDQALQQAAAAAATQEKTTSSSSKKDKEPSKEKEKEKEKSKEKEKEKEKKAKQDKEAAAKKKKEQDAKNKKKKGPKVRSLEDLEAMRAAASTIRTTPLSNSPFAVPAPSSPGLIFDEDVVFIIPTKSFRHAQIAKGILSKKTDTWGSLVKNPTIVFSNEYAAKQHGFRTQILTAPHVDWTPLDNRYNSWRMMQMMNYLYEGMHTPTHPEYDRLQKVQFVIWLGDGTFPLLDQIKKKLDAFRAAHGGSYPLYAGGSQMKANFYKAFWPNQQGKAHNLYKAAPFMSSVSWLFGTSREFIEYVAEFADVDKCPLPIGDDKAIAAMLICAGGISEEMKSRIMYDFFTLEKKAPKQALESGASLDQWRKMDAYNGLSNIADVADATEKYYVNAGLLQPKA